MTRDARQHVSASTRVQRTLPAARILSLLVGAVAVATISAALRISAPPGLGPPDLESAIPTSLEPLASPASPESGIEVETSITELANVPPALANRAWISGSGERWQAGELDSTARVLLPPDEVPIAASGSAVATVVNGPLFADQRSTILRVRDMRTGAIIRELKSDLYIDIASFADAYLFFSGTAVNASGLGEAEIYPGGGLWAWDLSGPADAVLVVPPEATVRMSSAPFGDGIRAPLRVSATGRTLASAVYLADGTTGRVDVIDVPALQVRATLPRYVYAVDDNSALMQAAADSGNKVELIDLGSGEALWASTLSDDGSGPVMILQAFSDGGQIVLQFERSPRLIVATIDSASGSMRELLVQDGADKTVVPLYMEPGLSSATVIVMLARPGVAAALEAADGRARATVLDGATGQLTDDAFVIGAQ